MKLSHTTVQEQDPPFRKAKKSTLKKCTRVWAVGGGRPAVLMMPRTNTHTCNEYVSRPSTDWWGRCHATGNRGLRWRNWEHTHTHTHEEKKQIRIKNRDGKKRPTHLRNLVASRRAWWNLMNPVKLVKCREKIGILTGESTRWSTCILWISKSRNCGNQWKYRQNLTCYDIFKMKKPDNSWLFNGSKTLKSE